MLLEVLKEMQKKAVVSEVLLFPVSGMLLHMRSRPPAQALPVLLSSHERAPANELEQLRAR